MARPIVLAGIISIAALLAAGCGRKQEDEQAAHQGHSDAGDSVVAPAGAEIAQKTCPVMGGKIDKSIYVDHGGRRIYFCCPACVEKFKADPEPYLKKVDAELAAAGAD